MDCVVVPSLWEEAFGFVALEAMSLGKPVVATRSGNLPELVVPGENGLLINKGDSKALANAILTLASDEDGAKRLGAAGKEKHQTQYLIEHFGQRVEAAYFQASSSRNS
ncbi:MAG TPA: glycosyltransferase family 4 protein, partial [Fimbriimonadaceae bacterium]|nr:glycosyltransferase family 4 protein [Fimbriimonadaceae bacterium]